MHCILEIGSEGERARDREVSMISSNVDSATSILLFIKHVNDGKLTVSSVARETGDMYANPGIRVARLR